MIGHTILKDEVKAMTKNEFDKISTILERVHNRNSVEGKRIKGMKRKISQLKSKGTTRALMKARLLKRSLSFYSKSTKYGPANQLKEIRNAK